MSQLDLGPGSCYLERCIGHPRQESLLLIIDVQQAMLKVMNGWRPITAKIRHLTAAAGQLGVPILLMEQYAKGLGGTIEEVLEGIEAPRVFHKEHFSACLASCLMCLYGGKAHK